MESKSLQRDLAWPVLIGTLASMYAIPAVLCNVMDACDLLSSLIPMVIITVAGTTYFCYVKIWRLE